MVPVFAFALCGNTWDPSVVRPSVLTSASYRRKLVRFLNYTCLREIWQPRLPQYLLVEQRDRTQDVLRSLEVIDAL